MKLGMEVGLRLCQIVLNGDPIPLPQRGTAPNCQPCLLWLNGWMDQDVAWYGSRPRPTPHCVRWGLSSPSLKWHSPPIFGPCLLWRNGWMGHMMPLGREVGLCSGHTVLDGDPAPLPQRGTALAPFFGPCLLWPNAWMDQGATW